jgi:four helix bundle protein
MGRLTGDLKERTLGFGRLAMDALRELPNEPRGWIVAKQLGRAASSIGANVWEADAAISEADFAHKISIARKESSETRYWLELAKMCELLPLQTCETLTQKNDELLRILGTIVRKTQEHMKRKRG